MLPTVVEQQPAGRCGEGSSLASLPSATAGEGEGEEGEGSQYIDRHLLPLLAPHPQSPRVCV